MSSNRSSSHSHIFSLAGLVVALGIIYGDIGTSPLYVLKAIVGETPIDKSLVLGGVSAVFWTLTLLTTIKYVWLVLRADNNGEGGIFSLYALVRRRGKWLVFPAIIGGAALLADGLITPPISVSSAIEGLRIIYPKIPTVPIVVTILLIFFTFQFYGTKKVGSFFGPMMLVWFSMLAILGFIQILNAPYVLEALNPWYTYWLLTHHPQSLWILGAVFLCTTGAEALYSDLGHCGRQNIRATWIFVKFSLVMNYLGQAAWLCALDGMLLEGRNPFFEIMPRWFLPLGIFIATTAAIIASQALISGSFTLVTEAMRLYLFPKLKVSYPSELRGQVYLPAMNLILCVGCIWVVLHFRESSNMEAAYGLSITITMLMTTILYSAYLKAKRAPWWIIAAFLGLYIPIEGSFLFANLLKFFHGGYVTLFIGGAFGIVMYVWFTASKLKRQYTEYVDFSEYLPALKDLTDDNSVPKYATNLVYMTGASVPELIESKIIYSIFRKRPKRSDVYWFLHVHVVDEPYTLEYKVTPLITGQAIRVDFNLGFRVEPRINVFFRRVVEELNASGEVSSLSRYDSLKKNKTPGDFRFVVLEKALSAESALPPKENLIMRIYYLIKPLSLSEERSFGLDTSSVVSEKVPLVISPMRTFEMKRVA